MPSFQVAGDLGLTADGSDFFLAAGLHAIKQEISIGASIFLGLWPYDKREGIDYEGRVLLKGVTEQQIRDVMSSFLRSVDNVVEILSIDCDLDNAERSATVKFKVRCTTGGLLSGQLPFEVVSL